MYDTFIPTTNIVNDLADFEDPYLGGTGIVGSFRSRAICKKNTPPTIILPSKI